MFQSLWKFYSKNMHEIYPLTKIVTEPHTMTRTNQSDSPFLNQPNSSVDPIVSPVPVIWHSITQHPVSACILLHFR